MLGVATAWPPVYLILFLIGVSAITIFLSPNRPSGQEVSPFAVAGFVAVFAVHMLTIVLVFALIAIYVVLALNNEQLEQSKKIAWVVLLCLFTMVTMPLYWYMYVWRKPMAASASTS